MNIAAFKRLAVKNLGACLQKLSELLDKKRKDVENALLGFEGRLNRIGSDKRSGTIDPSALENRLNQLTQDVLEFIDTLQDEHFSTFARLREEIHEKLLVVCSGESALTRLKPYFNSNYFINVEYTFDFDPVKIDRSDIVVFTNPLDPLPPTTYQSILDQYFEKSSKYILYFGSHNEKVSKYPHKVYATNSPFSLYARLREMIEFMKYFNQTTI